MQIYILLVFQLLTKKTNKCYQQGNATNNKYVPLRESLKKITFLFFIAAQSFYQFNNHLKKKKSEDNTDIFNVINDLKNDESKIFFIKLGFDLYQKSILINQIVNFYR